MRHLSAICPYVTLQPLVSLDTLSFSVKLAFDFFPPFSFTRNKSPLSEDLTQTQKGVGKE